MLQNLCVAEREREREKSLGECGKSVDYCVVYMCCVPVPESED